MKKLRMIAAVVVSVLCLGGGISFWAITGNKTPKAPQDVSQSATAEAPKNDSYWDEHPELLDTDWAGSGSKDDPWLISSAAELAGLSYVIYNNTKPDYLSTNAYFVDKYFRQTANIDVSSYWWQPIGIRFDRLGNSIDRSFCGHYDGDGRTVAGVYTKAGSVNTNSYQGLFGFVATRDGTVVVCNVGVIDSFIQGFERVGAVVGGDVSGAQITNCYNTSIVSGSGGAIGGVVGYGSKIKNCYNMGSVTGYGAEVGGVIGDVGNLLVNCYNTGTVTGGTYVGGVVGRCSTRNMMNCYNTGSVNGEGNYVGGVAGTTQRNVTLSNCYYGGNCTLIVGTNYGIDDTTKISNLNTTSYAKNKDWYTNVANWDSTYPWDFDNVWKIDASKNDGYPTLLPPTWLNYAASSYAGGSGTEQDPYIIKTAEQLALIAKQSYEGNLIGIYFKQEANLNLIAHAWVPIGNISIKFRGSFDGNLYTIRNINTLKEDEKPKNGGLFGAIEYAEIESVVLKDSIIYGAENTGALVGFNETSSVVRNCILDNVVVYGGASNASAGILAGCFTNGKIRNCVVKNSSIISDGPAGGISGWRGTIIDCAVVNSIVNSGWADEIHGIGWTNSTVESSYSNAVCKGTQKLVMYGEEEDFGEWTYNPKLNGGYPIQSELYTLGGYSTSKEVYDALYAMGFRAP